MASIRPLPGLNAGQTLQARSMSEAELQEAVMSHAKILGYHRIHFRPARTAKGWRTAYEGETGYPDVTLAGGTRAIVWELKNQTRKLDPLQASWLAAWDLCGAHTWDRAAVRPSDWISGAVEDVLNHYAPRRSR